MVDEIELVSIRYENVRGFYDTALPLENTKSLIVGRNNAGKTSAFLLLSWLINDADPARLSNTAELTEQECALLLPARSAKHRARRVSLTVQFADGRKARPFKPIGDKQALLRIGFRVSGKHPAAFIRLGRAKRGDTQDSDPQAVKLLEHIQALYSVVHIPSARDASSDQFRDRFRNLFWNKLSERALHPGKQSGSTTEFKQITGALNSLEGLTTSLLGPILEDLTRSLPNGLLQSPNVGFENGADRSLMDWIVDQLTLKLITGDHDDNGVIPPNVGAGLQSVLDIAVARVILAEGNKKFIVAVEEPEAFLHPSLQRVIARQLLSEQNDYKTLVSTHSPILVSEAKYEHLLLAVDRKIQAPKVENDPRRSDIHSALLDGQGAEMVFAASVLLVEGEGDQAFFDGLRCRLAQRDHTGRIDDLFVIEVGGKMSFGPWLKLLQALNNGSSPPLINFIAVPDGDATSEVLRAFRDSNIDVDSSAVTKLADARQSYSDYDFDQWRDDLRQANKHLLSPNDGGNLCFLEGDLEYAMFSGLTCAKCQEIAESIDVTFDNKRAFIKKMGSKAIDGSGGDKKKAPYLRRLVSEEIPLSQISSNVEAILSAWLINGGFKAKDVKSLICDN